MLNDFFGVMFVDGIFGVVLLVLDLFVYVCFSIFVFSKRNIELLVWGLVL